MVWSSLFGVTVDSLVSFSDVAAVWVRFVGLWDSTDLQDFSLQELVLFLSMADLPFGVLEDVVYSCSELVSTGNFIGYLEIADEVGFADCLDQAPIVCGGDASAAAVWLFYSQLPVMIAKTPDAGLAKRLVGLFGKTSSILNSELVSLLASSMTLHSVSPIVRFLELFEVLVSLDVDTAALARVFVESYKEVVFLHSVGELVISGLPVSDGLSMLQDLKTCAE